MDLHEQRITCLRMALEMGCKADSIVAVASELMNFVATGAVLPAVAGTASEATSEDAIAACGTALPAAEAADLVPDRPQAVHADAPHTEPAVAEATVAADALPEAAPSNDQAPATEATAAASAAEPAGAAEVAPTTTDTSAAPEATAACADVAPEPVGAADTGAAKAEPASQPAEEPSTAPAEVPAMVNGAQGEPARAG